MTTIDFLLNEVQDKDISRKLSAFQKWSDLHAKRLKIKNKDQGEYEIKAGNRKIYLNTGPLNESLISYNTISNLLKTKDHHIEYDKRTESQTSHWKKGRDLIKEKLEKELKNDKLLKEKYEDIQRDPSQTIINEAKYLKRVNDGYKPLIHLIVKTENPQRNKKISAQNSEMKVNYI